MVDYAEKEAYQMLSLALKEAIIQSDLTDHVSLDTFAFMMNHGILTGEPLTQTPMFAYLTKEQNSHLQMPMSLQSENSADGLDLMRLQAPVEEYLN